MNKISIDKISDLNKILDKIHDQRFDVSEIKSNHEILTIRFRKLRYGKCEIIKKNFLWKKVKIPVEECYLNIFFVKSYEIIDTEKFGLYDFNTI